MIFRKKESKIKLFFLNQVAYFIIGLILLALIAHPLSKKIFQRYRLNSEIRDLSEEIKKMESHNKDLKNLISYLDSKNFTEEEARLNLNLKKAGEEVVVIKNNNDMEIKNTPEINLEKNQIILVSNKKEINPIRWWNHFFN